MVYSIVLSKNAEKDITELKKSNPSSFKKLKELIIDVSKNPKTGLGKPENLKGNLIGLWSRRIDKKNRLVYSIEETTVSIHILSALDHYNDK